MNSTLDQLAHTATHQFRYDYVSCQAWNGARSPVGRRCERCGLIEIRGVYEGAEFTAMNRPEGECSETEGGGA